MIRDHKIRSRLSMTNVRRTDEMVTNTFPTLPFNHGQWRSISFNSACSILSRRNSNTGVVEPKFIVNNVSTKLLTTLLKSLSCSYAWLIRSVSRIEWFEAPSEVGEIGVCGASSTTTVGRMIERSTGFVLVWNGATSSVVDGRGLGSITVPAWTRFRLLAEYQRILVSPSKTTWTRRGDSFVIVAYLPWCFDLEAMTTRSPIEHSSGRISTSIRCK